MCFHIREIARPAAAVEIAAKGWTAGCGEDHAARRSSRHRRDCGHGAWKRGGALAIEVSISEGSKRTR